MTDSCYCNVLHLTVLLHNAAPGASNKCWYNLFAQYVIKSHTQTSKLILTLKMCAWSHIAYTQKCRNISSSILIIRYQSGNYLSKGQEDNICTHVHIYKKVLHCRCFKSKVGLKKCAHWTVKTPNMPFFLVLKLDKMITHSLLEFVVLPDPDSFIVDSQWFEYSKENTS